MVPGRLTVLIAVLGVVLPFTSARGDNKPSPKQKPTPADDEARLIGKWTASVTVDKEKWTYTFEFKKDGAGWLHMESPQAAGARNFSYEVIDLRGGRRVIAFTNSNAFPAEGILVLYDLDSDELLLYGGQDSRGADLKGKWKRVPDKNK